MEMFFDAVTQLEKNQTERIAISYRRDYPVKEETWVGEVCSDFIGLNTDNDRALGSTDNEKKNN
jgi:hypothetical protein